MEENIVENIAEKENEKTTDELFLNELLKALPKPEIYATGIVRDCFGNIKN